MNRRNYKLFGGLFIVALLSFVSCSKSENEKKPDEKDNDSRISMLIDGQKVETRVAHITTFRPNESNDVDNFSLQIYGSDRLAGETYEGSSFKFFIDLSFPIEAEFKNPKGTYKIGHTTIDKIASARYIIGNAGAIHSKEYNSNDKSEEYKENYGDHEVGQFKIESFKMEDLKVYGVSVGEGYGRLSGTFEMELTTNSGEKIKITEGKFDVKNKD